MCSYHGDRRRVEVDGKRQTREGEPRPVMETIEYCFCSTTAVNFVNHSKHIHVFVNCISIIAYIIHCKTILPVMLLPL